MNCLKARSLRCWSEDANERHGGSAGFSGLLPRLAVHAEALSSLESRTEDSKVQPSGHTERQDSVTRASWE